MNLAFIPKRDDGRDGGRPERPVGVVGPLLEVVAGSVAVPPGVWLGALTCLALTTQLEVAVCQRAGVLLAIGLALALRAPAGGARAWALSAARPGECSVSG